MILFGWRHFLFKRRDTLAGTAAHGNAMRVRYHWTWGEKIWPALAQWKEKRNSRCQLIDGGESIHLIEGKTIDRGEALLILMPFQKLSGVRESFSMELGKLKFQTHSSLGQTMIPDICNTSLTTWTFHRNDKHYTKTFKLFRKNWWMTKTGDGCSRR